MADVEYLGFLATLMVVISFMFQHVVLIRMVNGFGSLLFVVYGFLIHSPSVALLNTIVMCIQVVQLVRLRKRTQNTLPIDRTLKASVLQR